MTVQTLKQSTGITAKPFVVKESDLDLFSCEELSPTPRTQRFTSQPDEICNFEISPTPKRKMTRRSSTCSNSTSSSNSSSIASKTGSIASKRSTRSRRRLASTSTKPKKSVRFHSRVNFCRIPHLSDKDITHRWYGPSELAAIKSDAVETIRHAKDLGVETFPDDSEHTVRGLYCSKKQQRRSRSMARSSVLDEQKRQAREGVDDPENLAMIYSSFAFASEQIAQVNGQEDADVARRLR
jgi:hypothetical protein